MAHNVRGSATPRGARALFSLCCCGSAHVLKDDAPFFCPRPGLRVGEEEATAARTWGWCPQKISVCARRRRSFHFSGRHFCISRGERAHHYFLRFGSCLPLLCNLFIRVPRVIDLGPTCKKRWRSGVPCATWPAAFVSLFTWPRENNTGLCVVIWGTSWVETDSVSAQMRRNRRQGSPLVALRRIHHFAAGTR